MFGSKFEFKISEVVNLIKSQLNYKGKVKWVKSNLKRVKRRNINLKRITKIGFKEKITLNNGIKKTINWLISNYKSARK